MPAVVVEGTDFLIYWAIGVYIGQEKINILTTHLSLLQESVITS